MPKSMPPEELHQLRQLLRPGILLALVLRMGQLPNVNPLAEMLELDHRTVRRYLAELVKMRYIQRLPDQSGYCLSSTLSEEQRAVLGYFGCDHSRGA